MRGVLFCENAWNAASASLARFDYWRRARLGPSPEFSSLRTALQIVRLFYNGHILHEYDPYMIPLPQSSGYVYSRNPLNSPSI